MNNVADCYYSSLGDDPDLADLVVEFVADLPQRADKMREYHAAADSANLSRIAHQLKGAAGSYGFPIVSEVAGRLEHALRVSHDDREVLESLQSLLSLCDRVRAGVPHDN